MKKKYTNVQIELELLTTEDIMSLSANCVKTELIEEEEDAINIDDLFPA